MVQWLTNEIFKFYYLPIDKTFYFEGRVALGEVSRLFENFTESTVSQSRDKLQVSKDLTYIFLSYFISILKHASKLLSEV